MAGGLLNIVATGEANLLINGNPKRTYFEPVAIATHTNFGIQKIRLDYAGSRDLRLTEPSIFTFKVERYADLLMDCYLGITLPNIWSPIYPPSTQTSNSWAPYDFRWIENLGAQMISNIEIQCGNYVVSKYSGDYIMACVERDYTTDKKNKFNKMIGHTNDLNNPANAFGRVNTYPSAFVSNTTNLILGTEPSIRGRQLYVPLNAWFSQHTRNALPLCSASRQEIKISITIRPIDELFQIRDIFDQANAFPYIQPDFNQIQNAMYHFLQSPPSQNVSIENNSYTNTNNTWNADIHLLASYIYLDKKEKELFQLSERSYIIKDVIKYTQKNVSGSATIPLTSNGMVSSWMWYLQRNDVNMRNEWSNYSNWPYRSLPYNIQLAPRTTLQSSNINLYGPQINPNGFSTGFFISGDYNINNQKNILLSTGILLDGEYREQPLNDCVFNLVEQYNGSLGSGKDGLYCYNYCFDTNPHNIQSSGAINLGMFRKISLEMTTFVPPVDTEKSQFNVICNGTGDTVAVSKSNWQLYEYSYDLTLFEERYNVLSFASGTCGLRYAR